MRTSLHIIFFLFVLVMNGFSQTDSLQRGTIHISRPDIRATVNVSVEYAVYMRRSDAPKLGRLTGTKQKYIRSKDLRSFGQNEENPVPLVEYYHFVGDAKHRTIMKTDIPFDTLSNVTATDSLVDLASYLQDTIRYFYKYKDGFSVDTVQLLVHIDRKGKYRYNFVSRDDSLSKPGPKCMESLTAIHKWQPAHIFHSKKDGRTAKRKRAYSEALITIVISSSPQLFENTEEESKK